MRYRGKQSVRIEGRGTTKDASGQTLHPNFVSAEIPLEIGETYRLTARIKADRPDTAFAMMPQSTVDKVYFWGAGTAGQGGNRMEGI